MEGFREERISDDPFFKKAMAESDRKRRVEKVLSSGNSYEQIADEFDECLKTLKERYKLSVGYR